MNTIFVIYEEVIDIFHNHFYITTVEICHLIYLMYILLVQWNVGRL